MTGEATGFLTTGDGLVDGILRGLNQSQRNATESFLALARAVLFCSMHEVEDETVTMAQAREWMRNAALTFEREFKLAQAQAGGEG